MSWISATDPLALVAIQAGQVNTPSRQEGAAGGSQLDSPQRAVQIGEPVPIVFARRRNGKGGVLISPGATEARFTNDTSNAVTASYHLVLGEGLLGQIPVKDIFQRSCRVGSHSQTYSRRAGTWTPGNFIVQRSGYELPECPYYCGSLGSYPRMSTLSFVSGAVPDGFDFWNRQVHCFIRNGMYVKRLGDELTGPSDSFADLTLWSWINSSKLPGELVDIDALQDADAFLEANGFTCNCWITESTNISDLLLQWGPYFLLGESNYGGKKGLRPILPTNPNGTINTSTIIPAFTFNDDKVLPDSLEVTYTSLADRQPFVAQMVWRQQLEDDFGIIRTAEVRIAGTAESGPYESHDLSEFATNEDHAVKAGAYLVARRYYTTHTMRFVAKPGTHSTTVSQGDIIRVRLRRIASSFQPTFHDYLYQVERITKTLAGDVSYECTHFPVDALGRSLVALAVANATGIGINLPSVKSGISCDVNSSTNDTIPTPTWTDPPGFDPLNPDAYDPSDPIDIEDPWSFYAASWVTPSTSDGGSLPISAAPISPGEESEPPGEPEDDLPLTGPATPGVGDTISMAPPPDTSGCDFTTDWYTQNGKLSPLVYIGSGGTITLPESSEGSNLIGIGRLQCPDDEPKFYPSVPAGPIVEAYPYTTYQYARWTGTIDAEDPFTGSTVWFRTDLYEAKLYTAGSEGNFQPSAPQEGLLWAASFPPLVNITDPPATALSVLSILFAGKISGDYAGGVSEIGRLTTTGEITGSISGAYEFTDDIDAGPQFTWSGFEYDE
jgi:hypothetical protein